MGKFIGFVVLVCGPVVAFVGNVAQNLKMNNIKGAEGSAPFRLYANASESQPINLQVKFYR